MFDSNREHESYTKDSPDYGIGNKLLKVCLLSIGLLVFNIFIMVYMTETALVDYTKALFEYPIVGVIMFGLILTSGRYLSLKSLQDKQNTNHFLLLSGLFLLLGGYGAFGATILSYYSSGIWFGGLVATLSIVIIILMLIVGYVTNTDKDLSKFAKYSSICFILGIILVLMGTFIEGVLMLAFPLFILGFLADLVYEIWMAVTSDRSAYQNGIAVYVALAGVFVHILQLVMEMLADQ